MDFTIKKYKELISALKDAGYEFVTYAEYCEGLRTDKFIVIRHDVDRSVERARRLAEVELEVGVKASYYFRDKFHSFSLIMLLHPYREQVQHLQ